jgi:hypothetical protein
MPEPSLQATVQDSFRGDYLYEQVIPQDHPLRLLREVVPLERYSRHRTRYYRSVRCSQFLTRPALSPTTTPGMTALFALPSLVLSHSITFF